MLGRGLIEFRPTSVVAIGPGGQEQVKYHVDYRGDASRVVVLPRDAASFTHMIIDFSGPDRAVVAGVGCHLTRAGGQAAAVAPMNVKWEMLASTTDNGGVVTYVDRASIHRSGGVAQMWELWDFKSAHAFEGKRFLSVRNQFEYDCSRMRRRMLSTRGFAQHMGQGTIVASGDDVLPWQGIDAGSLFVDHWKAACARS